jgi:hypothetical protein
MRAIVFLAVVLLAMPAAARQWLAAEESGCQVWNEEPRPGETVTWTGRCLEGKAQGYGALIREYVNGNWQVLSIHWGEMEAGKSLGFGTWQTSVREIEARSR